MALADQGRSDHVISLVRLTLDGGTQPRAELDEDVIGDYAAAMSDGAEFPPVVVYHDGSHYWLADGFHRVYAAKQQGRTSIRAMVRQGTRRDAVLYSVSANAAHGLRRSNADKRRAVETLLTDAEWRKWTDNKIAQKCGVANSFVGDVRRSLQSDQSDKDLTPRTYQTKHGTVATMDTRAIGKGKKLAEAAPMTPWGAPIRRCCHPTH